MRRARRQLNGPLALAGVVLVAACGRPADPVRPTEAPPVAAAPAPAVAAAAAATAGTPGPAPAAVEAVCATAPLGVRVVAVRHESADSIRVELALSNLAPADGWKPGSPLTASVRAAVDALEGLSIVSSDGRRRLFALRGSTGQRVGAALVAPVPGKPEAFWALFPAADGPVSLLLPGFAPLTGLAVAPPGRSEP
jgi:hypothetical protein